MWIKLAQDLSTALSHDKIVATWGKMVILSDEKRFS